MIVRCDESLDVPTPTGGMRAHPFRPAVPGRFPCLLFCSEIYRVTGLGALSACPAWTGRLATLGVCLGGHLACRAALDPRVSAAACFYPTDIHSGTLGADPADDSPARMAHLKAEPPFVFGRQDPHVPFAGRRMIRARLEEVGAITGRHELDAAHALLRDPRLAARPGNRVATRRRPSRPSAGRRTCSTARRRRRPDPGGTGR